MLATDRPGRGGGGGVGRVFTAGDCFSDKRLK